MYFKWKQMLCRKYISIKTSIGKCRNPSSTTVKVCFPCGLAHQKRNASITKPLLIWHLRQLLTAAMNMTALKSYQLWPFKVIYKANGLDSVCFQRTVPLSTGISEDKGYISKRNYLCAQCSQTVGKSLQTLSPSECHSVLVPILNLCFSNVFICLFKQQWP